MVIPHAQQAWGHSYNKRPFLQSAIKCYMLQMSSVSHIFLILFIQRSKYCTKILILIICYVMLCTHLNTSKHRFLSSLAQGISLLHNKGFPLVSDTKYLVILAIKYLRLISLKRFVSNFKARLVNTVPRRCLCDTELVRKGAVATFIIFTILVLWQIVETKYFMI